ncbi:beta-lactamase family protein [Aureobasidium pullulans]|uniref:Beta-lactamase family protein n=1 Tax=Aureobasidium pullulans TaxID=5580 RepID=A0A4S9UAU7_AURPU|nr:beta-lactamase family protein [Aureobasidium pullulans]
MQPCSHGFKTMSWLDEPATISRINNLMKDFHVPGLAIAIIDGSEIRSRAFGNACLDPPTPCTPDTIFDIASCSKALTSLAVALLVENEHEFSTKVQWDSLMSSLLPDDFVLPTAEATNMVTVEDVLSHRTGLPSHDLSILSIESKHPDTSQKTLNPENTETTRYDIDFHRFGLLVKAIDSPLHTSSMTANITIPATRIHPKARVQGRSRAVLTTTLKPHYSSHLRICHSAKSIPNSWKDTGGYRKGRVARNKLCLGLGCQVSPRSQDHRSRRHYCRLRKQNNVGAVILGNSEGAFHLILDQVLETPFDQRGGFANSRVKRFKAQEARREKNFKRNFGRREQAKGTSQVDMEAYQGPFWNIGYRTLIVREMDGCLCVDGRDRIRFKFDTEGRVIAVGLGLEKALGTDHLIWFTREVRRG